MKRIKQTLLAMPMFALAGLGSGCMQLQDLRLESQQRRLARSAWGTAGGMYCHVAHSADFRQGFEAGYYDVASGGDGCPPALPPKKYWGAAYQSPAGQEHTKAWFAGFREGAEAAKRDGVSSYSTIYVSPEHRRAAGNDPASQLQSQPYLPSTNPSAPLQPTPTTAPATPPGPSAPPRIDVLPPRGYQPPAKAQAPIDLQPAPMSNPGSTPPNAPTPNLDPQAGRPSMAVEPAPIMPGVPQAHAEPRPSVPTSSILAPISSTERVAPLPMTPAAHSASVAKPVLPVAPTTPTLPPANARPDAQTFQRDWQPVMPVPIAEVKATTTVPTVVSTPTPTAPMRSTPATVVKETSVQRTPAPIPNEFLEPPAPVPVQAAPTPATVKAPATHAAVKRAAAVEAKRPSPAPATFVKPDANPPSGFVPEVLMGMPRKLEPDGSIVP